MDVSSSGFIFVAATSAHASHYGYWGVAGVVAAESLGVPLPGETALIAAAAYAGESHTSNPWLIFAIAALAAFLGNAMGYVIGWKGGFPLAVRYGPKVHLDEHKLKIARYVLDTQGWKVVVIGRFLAVFRTYMAFLAGTVQMRKREFFTASAVAAAAWSGFYTAAAYNSASTLKGLSRTVDILIGAIAVVTVGITFFFVRNRVKKLGEKAEAAYPGHLLPHPEEV